MKLTFTIDRFEGDYAVLLTPDNAVINWPKKQLPAEAREGAVLVFEINSDEMSEAARAVSAKDLLNEILAA